MGYGKTFGSIGAYRPKAGKVRGAAEGNVDPKDLGVQGKKVSGTAATTQNAGTTATKPAVKEAGFDSGQQLRAAKDLLRASAPSGRAITGSFPAMRGLPRVVVRDNPRNPEPNGKQRRLAAQMQADPAFGREVFLQVAGESSMNASGKFVHESENG